MKGRPKLHIRSNRRAKSNLENDTLFFKLHKTNRLNR